MLFKEIIAVYTENFTKAISTQCARSAELQITKVDGTYRYHWALTCLFLEFTSHYFKGLERKTKSLQWKERIYEFYPAYGVELRDR
jgi:hypothetical protein